MVHFLLRVFFFFNSQLSETFLYAPRYRCDGAAGIQTPNRKEALNAAVSQPLRGADRRSPSQQRGGSALLPAGSTATRGTPSARQQKPPHSHARGFEGGRGAQCHPIKMARHRDPPSCTGQSDLPHRCHLPARSTLGFVVRFGGGATAQSARCLKALRRRPRATAERGLGQRSGAALGLSSPQLPSAK